MEDARKLHEAAVRWHMEHARHARERGDGAMAQRAEKRAQRAWERARLSQPQSDDELSSRNR